jgi:anti-sigma regulatory factor (Ser/Thr protein kinase)
MSGPTKHDVELVLSSAEGALVSITAAVDRLVADHDLPPKTRFNLELIIEELVLNSMTHGRRGDEEHEIVVRVRVGAERLTVQIEDDGRPYDPVLQAPPAPVEQSTADRPIGGVGVHLVRRLAESYEYAHRGGKNVITLDMRRAPGCVSVAGPLKER